MSRAPPRAVPVQDDNRLPRPSASEAPKAVRFQTPQSQPDTEDDEPEPDAENDEPEPDAEDDEPELDTDDYEPEPDAEDDEPELDTDDYEPEPDAEDDEPEPDTEHDEPEPELNADSSLWNIPGIDKDTFYAAALYLHTAVGDLEGRSWSRGPMTPPETREFLDHLANCFARSKLPDAPDHVSATAMVRDEKQMKITLYISKNRSSPRLKVSTSETKTRPVESDYEDDNDTFANFLTAWFNRLTKAQSQPPKHDAGEPAYEDEIFSTMCKFNLSRLEFYIKEISKLDIDDLQLVVPPIAKQDSDHVLKAYVDTGQEFSEGWEGIKAVIEKCQRYEVKDPNVMDSVDQKFQRLKSCAILASETRQRLDFRRLTDKVETSAPQSKLKRLTGALEGVKYLGRLYAAYRSFSRFCKNDRQQNYSFQHKLLESQEDEWIGESYMNKCRSWTGNLGLTEKSSVTEYVGGKPLIRDRTIMERMQKVINDAGNRAPVHCEVRLMMHFLRLNAPKCEDYFGCSKKSCWLCWHMMVQNQVFSMKDTHRRLYPCWALPLKFSPLQPQIAEGLKIAYDEMMALLQSKVIRQANLTPLGPYLQSSAMMTPPQGDQVFERWSSSSSLMVIADKIAVTSVPALHVPPDCSSKNVRHVRISLYEVGDSYTESPMTTQMFGDTKVAFAFQLKTKPDVVGEVTEINEAQHHYWEHMTFPHHLDPDPASWKLYHLYYRSAASSLKSNRCIRDVWRSVHGLEYRRLPWTGDVFIVLGRDPTRFDRMQPMAEHILSACDINSSLCFESLRRRFELEEADFSEKIRRDGREFAELVLEGFRDFSEEQARRQAQRHLGLID